MSSTERGSDLRWLSSVNYWRQVLPPVTGNRSSIKRVPHIMLNILIYIRSGTARQQVTRHLTIFTCTLIKLGVDHSDQHTAPCLLSRNSAQYRLELETNLREVWSFTITKKAPTNAFSFKTILRHYAEHALTHGKWTQNWDLLRGSDLRFQL